ncbi:MAG: cobalamin-binding protein [Coriobacteriaceae bacterium]|jgi:5-methyltetrahydrofolate--homocysteine methyltransferase|nr:cobalamin-binding protein [Coriobacteriaceae bacterium]
MTVLDDLHEKIMKGKRKETGPLVQQALDEGIDPEEILGVMVDAMGIIGDRFSKGEAFVPEMLVAARAMSAATDVLKPAMVAEGAEPLGHAVIGTVKADMHDIGKNLVRMMIEGKGVEIVDLGVDVEPERFVEHLKEHPECKVVCLSSLLTTTMPNLEATIKAIEDAGLRDRVKIMVGGAPVTQEFADKIGADAYTVDAGAAAERIAEFF